MRVKEVMLMFLLTLQLLAYKLLMFTTYYRLFFNMWFQVTLVQLVLECWFVKRQPGRYISRTDALLFDICYWF